MLSVAEKASWRRTLSWANDVDDIEQNNSSSTSYSSGQSETRNSYKRPRRSQSENCTAKI
jgi:hypothetical protein